MYNKSITKCITNVIIAPQPELCIEIEAFVRDLWRPKSVTLNMHRIRHSINLAIVLWSRKKVEVQ